MKTYQDAAKNIFIAIIKENGDDGEIEVGFDDEKAYLYLQGFPNGTGHFAKVQITLTKRDITDMISALQQIERMI